MLYKNTLINSSVAFITTAILEMILHEGGHFVTAVALGGKPALYHNYVQYGTLPSDTAHILCAIAGPAISLAIGLICHAFLRRNVYKGMATLMIAYLSMFGYTGFFGYMFTAPFFSYGDTGFVLRAIGCPLWLICVLAVGAVGIMYLITRKLSVYFISVMDTRTAGSFHDRVKFIYSLILFPVFIGIFITTLLNLPVPTTLSLIAPLTSPFVLLWPYDRYLKAGGIYFDDKMSVNRNINSICVVALIILIIINRLLVNGLSI